MSACKRTHVCVCACVCACVCVFMCACVLVCTRVDTSERGLCIYKRIHEGGSGANCSI